MSSFRPSPPPSPSPTRGTIPARKLLTRAAFVLAAAALVAPLAACTGPTKGTTIGAGAGANAAGIPGHRFVRGYLYVRVGGEQTAGNAAREGHEVYLPAAKVTLRERASGAVADSVRTDLSGRFSFSPVKPGRYRLCWEHRGVRSDCRKEDVDVTTRPVLTGPVAAALEGAPGMRAVHGRVSATKGSIRTFEPMFGVNAFARVRAVDGRGGVVDSAYVNNFGDYVLTRAPAGGGRVEAVLEAARAEAAVAAGTAPARLDLKFANSAPRVELLPRVNGTRVRTAAPGDVVAVEARAYDADGDKVRYLWYAPGGKGGVQSDGPTSARWDLPAAAGEGAVYVLASDGRGGYQRTRAVVSTLGTGVRFAGRVNATNAPAVDSAVVEVNGKTVRTNAAGWFVLDVPEAARYVLNIRKPGYALVSRVYAEPMGEAVWTLTLGTTRSVNPAQPVAVVDERRHQRCGVPVKRIPEARSAERLLPRWLDPGGDVARVGKEPWPQPMARIPGDVRLASLGEREEPRERCGPGGGVSIPANSLVDQDGNAPAGNVEVTVYTIDPRAPFDMPGDWTVAGPGGTGTMETYGALGIEVTGGGKKYNLRPGATARVTIPIDPAQLAAPDPEPATIPLLFYDDTTGVWRQEGTLQRQGNAYVADVPHFSTINADVLKVGQSCVHIHSPLLPPIYNLEVTIPRPGGAPRVMTQQIDNSTFDHVIYNLPNGTDIVLVPYSALNVPYGTFVVNTGGAQTPTSPNLPVDPDASCANTAELFDVTEPAPGADAFLHGLYSFNAANLTELAVTDPVLGGQFEAAGLAYYARIDPQETRKTLQQFKATNGFPGGETHAVYANAGDLGFGRDMHCRRTGSPGDYDVACYVTNFGSEATPDGLDFINAVGGNAPGATVAMEFSRVDGAAPGTFQGPQRVVKFYVYPPGVGDRIPAIELDGRGVRPVPQLCVVCHGGDIPNQDGQGLPSFPDLASVDFGSVFIPFDFTSLLIIDAIDPQFDKLAQQAAFRTLNREMVAVANPGATHAEIIDSMYAGGALNQREDFVVAAWRGDAADRGFYLDVLRPSCRMCHASRPAGAGINFEAGAAFLSNNAGSAAYQVCNQRVMPHALRTYNRFWGSIGPHQPAQLQAYGLAKGLPAFAAACSTPG